MKKANHWFFVLFALIFIVTPAMIAFSLWLPDWRPSIKKEEWFYWVVSLGFVIYVIVLSFLFFFLKILSIDIFTFYIPLALVFIAIFVSFKWNPIWRFIFVLVMMLLAWPLNIIVNHYKEKYRRKILRKRS